MDERCEHCEYCKDGEEGTYCSLNECMFSDFPDMPYQLDPSTGETFTEPRNDMDKTTIDSCRGAIELLEQEPCDDVISRQAVLSMQYRIDDSATLSTRDVVNVDDIEDLPPVNPQPKTGHWIVDSATSSQIGIHGKKTFSYDTHCDKCGWKWAYTTDHKDSMPSKFCPNCGAKMVEPQEMEAMNDGKSRSNLPIS